MPEITVSTLPKTWLFDIDGTLLVHNGHLHGADRALPGTRAFFDAHVGADDVVILLTAREETHRAVTERTLREAGYGSTSSISGCPRANASASTTPSRKACGRRLPSISTVMPAWKRSR